MWTWKFLVLNCSSVLQHTHQRGLLQSPLTWGREGNHRMSSGERTIRRPTVCLHTVIQGSVFTSGFVRLWRDVTGQLSLKDPQIRSIFLPFPFTMLQWRFLYFRMDNGLFLSRFPTLSLSLSLCCTHTHILLLLSLWGLSHTWCVTQRLTLTLLTSTNLWPRREDHLKLPDFAKMSSLC